MFGLGLNLGSVINKIVTAIVNLFTPSWSNEFTLLPQDSDGYSILTPVTGSVDPADDSRIYYVDPVNGNDGTARYYSGDEFADVRNPTGELAYQDYTVAEALLREGYPDWLVFKRGEEFILPSSISISAGASNSAHMVYTTYGSSPARPVLKTAVSVTAFDARVKRYFSIVGFEAYAYQKAPDSPDYVGYVNSGISVGGVLVADNGGVGGPVSGDFLIEDNHFRDYGSGISIIGSNDVELRTNCIIRRNIIDRVYHAFDGSHAQGFWCLRASVLLEENVFYHCGWYETLDYESTLAVALTGAAETQVVLADAIPADRPQQGEMFVQSDDTTVTHINYTSWTGNTYTIPATDFTAIPASVGQRSGSPYHKPSMYSHSLYNAYIYQCIYRNNISIDPASIGFKITSNPTISNTILTEDVSMYNNIFYGGEVGISPSGNSSFSDGYRWSNYQINHNAMIAIGIRMPTERDVAYGIDFEDHVNSEATYNLFIHTDNPSITNYGGISNDGYSDNVTLSRNKIYAAGGTIGDISGGTGIEVSYNTVNLDASAYVDPTRKIETYMSSLGQTADVDTFISKCTAMKAGTYDADYSAESILAYLYAGYLYSSAVVIVTDLVDDTYTAGQPYTTTIDAVSDYDITYAWYVDGVLDATNTTTTFTSATNWTTAKTLKCVMTANGQSFDSAIVNITEAALVNVLNGTDAWMELTSLVSFTGDFNIQFDTNINALVNQALISKNSDATNEIIFLGDGNARAKIVGAWNTDVHAGTDWTIDANIHVEYRRVADSVEILLNDVLVGTQTSTATLSMNRVGTGFYGFVSGWIANLSYSGDGVPQTTFTLDSGALDGQTEESVEGGSFITMHNPNWV